MGMCVLKLWLYPVLELSGNEGVLCGSKSPHFYHTETPGLGTKPWYFVSYQGSFFCVIDFILKQCELLLSSKIPQQH